MLKKNNILYEIKIRVFNESFRKYTYFLAFDISAWLTPYFSKQIKNTMGPHLYKIEMNKDGKACIKTKHWSTDETSSTCEGAHEGVFLRTSLQELQHLSDPVSLISRSGTVLNQAARPLLPHG